MNPLMHQYNPEAILYGQQHQQRLNNKASGTCEKIRIFCQEYRACLALSFGKDSMVVLDLLRQSGCLEDLPLVMFNHSGVETCDTEAMRDYVIDTYHLTNFQETRPTWDTVCRTMALTDMAKTHPQRDFVYECLELPRWELMDRYEITGAMVGLRTAESIRRRCNFAMRGENYYNMRELNQILTPIIRWTTQEVWGFTALHQIPQHPVYAKLRALGFGPERLRHNTPLGVSFAHQGSLQILRKLYPKTFVQIRQLYPGLRALM